MSEETPIYGGQAVIEGVMMRGRTAYSIAVRCPDHSITVKTEPLSSIHQSRVARVPFLRGLIVLWDSLVLGMRALAFSANAQAEDESERIEGAQLTATLLVSLALGLLAFLLLPAGTAHLIQGALGLSPLATNVLEGVIRLSLLIGYIWAIGRSPDIERVFGYHGAEHMTIHAFEAEAPLQVGSVEGYPREHPRCGTAFLLTVAVLSTLLFSLLGPMPLGTRLLSRVLMIPVLASVAYEYIRLTARISHLSVARPLTWPNLALQRLTTRQPSADMIEVAIRSFEEMRASERSPQA